MYVGAWTSATADAWTVEVGRDHDGGELGGVVIEVSAMLAPETPAIVDHYCAAVGAARLHEIEVVHPDSVCRRLGAG
ncbi:hypothetical protein D514_0111580 [Microbacterium sp. UCD-TDU]|nr:hypothetical protein D514_0111580 [Microbacterium sp. UCD-TDU]